MKLDTQLVARIEAGEPSYVPPYPPRARGRQSLLAMLAAFRKSMVSAFSEHDFKRPLFRIRLLRREVIICNSPELVQETLSAQHETFQQKSAQLRHALKPLIGDGLFISDRELYKQRRSAVAPIVHPSEVSGFAPVMSETIGEWGQSWAEKGDGAELDVLAEMAELTAEIISRTVFGRRLGRRYTSSIVAGFKEYQSVVDQIDVLSLIGLPDWVPRLKGASVRRSTRRIHEVVDTIIDSHRDAIARGNASGAMVARLFDARTRDGQALSRDAIRNEAIVLFMAGHEGTANTLAWAWLNLSQSPRVRAALHAELDAVLAGRVPQFADVARLRYTRFVIEETLRLYPPVPILARRALCDGVLDGEPFARGTILIVSPWLLHRNPTIWTRADAFIPERFDPEIAPKPNRYTYIPFAIGPRICPGLTFGLTEAILALAGLAQRFDLTLKEGHRVEMVNRLTLRPGDHLPMTLHGRQRGGG